MCIGKKLMMLFGLAITMQLNHAMHRSTKLVSLQKVRSFVSFADRCVQCPGSVKDWYQQKVRHEIEHYERIFAHQKDTIQRLSDDQGTALIDQDYTAFVPFIFPLADPRLYAFNVYSAEKKHDDAADIAFGFYCVSKEPVKLSVASLIVTERALKKSRTRFMAEAIATVVRRNHVTDERLNAYRYVRTLDGCIADEDLSGLAYTERAIDCHIYEELLHKEEQLLVLSRLYPRERSVYLNALVRNTFPLKYNGFTVDELRSIINDLNREDEGFCLDRTKNKGCKRYITCKEGKAPLSLLKSLRNRIEE